MASKVFQGAFGPRAPRDLDETLKRNVANQLNEVGEELAKAEERIALAYAVGARELAFQGASNILDDEATQLADIARLRALRERLERTLKGFDVSKG